jgi:hypothetical protein
MADGRPAVPIHLTQLERHAVAGSVALALAVELSIIAAALAGRAIDVRRSRNPPPETNERQTLMSAVLTDTDVPTDTSPLEVKIVALVLAIAGPVLAFVDPSGKFSTADAQVLITLGAWVIAAAIYVGHLILRNGLSKAGIGKTLTEEEQWLKANAPALKATYEAAKPALDELPGVPAAQAAAEQEITSLKARFDALPPEQKIDLDEVAELTKTKLLATLAGPAAGAVVGAGAGAVVTDTATPGPVAGAAA